MARKPTAARGVNAPPTNLQPTDCSDDDAIRQAVIGNIKKAFRPSDFPVRLHFGVTCNNRIITLLGFAMDKGRQKSGTTKQQIITIAEKTPCVKEVNADRLGIIRGGGCGPTEKECNGGCIPRNASCPPLIG